MKLIVPILLSLVVVGCSCGPARWADEAPDRLQCGMTVAEVRITIGKDITALDVPRDWTTHMVRDGSTDLWLGFPEGRLRWVQVLWAQKMQVMAMYQRRDLCGG